MKILCSLVLGVLAFVAVAGAANFDTFAGRRAWVMEQAPTNADVRGFVLAQVHFARGNVASGQAAAVTASRSLLSSHLAKPSEQVQLFNIWPALDCYMRFGALLDEETRTNVQYVVTHFLGYAGTTTANLKTLGHVVRYLGSEAFGEAAFQTNAIWRTNDPNAFISLQSLIANNAKNGYGEHGSRPYYSKNLLPMLSLAQLATNPIISQRALLAFEGGLSQNAGCWMRGHLGVSSSRSYPDQETQRPMGSMRLMWLYFGGEAPPDKLSDPALAAVMNYEPPAVIQTAATNRASAFTSRGGYSGAQQTSFLDRDYVLFSQGPEYYGNFQVYADGVMWCDPTDSRFSFLWVCAPWNDDPAVNSGSWPHGMNRAIYSEAQHRDAMLQIYNFNPADTNRPPYVLCYVPGGWRAMVNDAATSGKIFLHYGTVMLALQAGVPFKWNTNSGIYAVSQSPVRAGDSEFRIWGAPISTNFQSISNLADSYIGTWNSQFALALETARPDQYPGAAPVDQLAAFRADILANTGLSHAPGSPPTGFYTNRHGDTLQVKQTSALTPSPIAINGQPLDFVNWPLTDNPWVYQAVGGPLALMTGPQTIVYDWNTWTVTTNPTPAAPTGLSAVATSPRRIALAWTDNATNETGFAIERSLDAQVGFVPLATLPANATNFADDSVVTGTTHHYRVRSLGAPMVWSPFTPVVPATPPPPGPERYQLRIDFTNYHRGEVLTNFPVLVVLNTNIPGFNYDSFLSPAGADLRFRAPGGGALNHEIERWNPAGDSFIWVQVPRFTNDCAVIARWGDPAAVTMPTSATNGATWSQDFIGVWHLSETNGAHRDSSPAQATSRSVAVTTQGTAVGMAAGCDDFDGVNDFISLPDMGLVPQVTVECWVNLDGPPAGSDVGLVSSDPWTTGTTHFKTSSAFQLKAQVNGGVSASSAASVISPGNWFHAAYAITGSGSNNLSLLLNGRVIATGTGAPTNNLTDVNIAREYSGRYLNARVDEVRISAVARSTNWLWAGVQNLTAPGSFQRASPVIVSGDQPLALGVAQMSNDVITLQVAGAEPWCDVLVQAATECTSAAEWMTVAQTNGAGGAMAIQLFTDGSPHRFFRALQTR
jgi:hypothetical protein